MKENEKPPNKEGVLKLHEKAREEIVKVIERLRPEYDIKISDETPETITLTVKDKNSKERTVSFMKMSGIEKTIEEKIRKPENRPEF